MKFTMTVNMDNVAFDDDVDDLGRVELARILRGVANCLLDGGTGTKIAVMDVNGNTVGSWGIK